MTAFHLLESRLLLEIYHIRLVLSQIQNPGYNSFQHDQFMFPRVNYLNPTLFHSISPPKPKPIEKVSTPKPDVNAIDMQPLQNVTLSTIRGDLSTNTTTPVPISINQTIMPMQIPATTTAAPETPVKLSPRQSLFPFLKSLPSTRKANGARDSEIHKFNNTILSGSEVQVFTYFWKIENYTEKLRAIEVNASDLYSPAFIISGFNLRIKASLNHLNRDYLYLRLEETPKNLTADISSVILETGDLFHEIETSNLFRYKITVLDQSPKKNDLISQEFSDTTSGFMIPSSALTATDTYTKDNLILIKVILYL